MRRSCPNQLGFHSRQKNAQATCICAFVLLFCTGGCGTGSLGGQNTPPPGSTFTTIDAPGAGAGSGYGTAGLSINAAGDIAGDFLDANGVAHGFIEPSGGSITTVDAPGAGTALNQGTNVRAINTSGNATGYYADSNGIFHSYIRTSSGTLTEFDPPNSVGSDAFCINDNGAVAGGFLDANGDHGFIRGSDGTFSVIDPTGTPSGITAVIPTQINSGGAVAGYYTEINSVDHGFLRDSSAAITILDAPGAGTATGTGTEITDMNTGGVIVGAINIGVVNGVITTHGFMRADIHIFRPSAGGEFLCRGDKR